MLPGEGGCLGQFEDTGGLIAGEAFLRVDHEADCEKPLLQKNPRPLEDGKRDISELRQKQIVRMMFPAELSK